MTGSLNHRRLAPLAVTLALAALALSLLFAPEVSIAAGTPDGWYADKSTIEGSSHSAAPTWPAHPRAIRLTRAAAPPTWPMHPRAIRPATSATATTPEHFDWGAAGIGAGVGALLTAICCAAVLMPTTRRARRARAA